MDIVQTYHQLIQDVETILALTDDVMIGLTIADVNQLVKMYDSMSKQGYSEKHNNVHTFKTRYINLDGLAADRRIEGILSWNNTYFRSVKVHTDVILDYLNRDDDTYYANVWSLIEDEKISVSRTHVAQFPLKSLESIAKFLLSHDARKIARAALNADGDDRDDGDMVFMTPMEKFMVKILMRDDLTPPVLVTCLKGLHLYAPPTYPLFPSGKVTKFGLDGGDLLQPILEHYRQHPVTPIVDYRKTVGIHIRNLDDFEKYVSVHPTMYASTISIELPYLCYAFIRRVEIDVYDELYSLNKTDPGERIYVSTGDEYVMQRFQKVPDLPETLPGHAPTMTTYCKTVQRSEEPSTYVKFDIGFFPVHVNAIRIYGEAISC
jgi:hypothetical protein